jgi:Ni2+-binding GTPase involved in maturation of urease and hydrogenase
MTFSGIVSLLQDFAFTDVFVIDSTTGKITTKRGLDREAKANLAFIALNDMIRHLGVDTFIDVTNNDPRYDSSD